MESSYRRSRLVCFALTLLVTVIMSTTAAAQGLFGIGFPAVPSVSGFLAGRATSGEPLGRGIAAPVFYAGYMIADPRALTVGVSSPGILGTTVDVSCEYSDKGGLWLGLSQGLQLSDRVGFTASAWYLLPTDSNYEETYDIPLAGGVGSRTWRTSRSWGWIDGMLVLGPPCGLNLIGGFRWDSYSLTYRDPGNVTGIVIGISTPFDEAYATANAYIPLIGTQYCCGGPNNGLLLRAVGFPWVPGSVTYGETGFFAAGQRFAAQWNYDRAYFLEVFGEYSRNFGGFGNVGVFGRWNGIYGRDGGATASIQPMGVTAPFDLVVNRTSWTLGGRFALNFAMPF